MKRWPLWLFLAYALFLFTGTHWPNLRIETPLMRRPDLLLHLGAFGTFTLLLWWSGLLGSRQRWATVPRVLAVGLAYAAFDELSQGLPGLGRTVALDDYLADALGVAAGTLASALGTWFIRRRSPAA
jgi:VanZ family protein